jgi:hypothetical protein
MDDEQIVELMAVVDFDDRLQQADGLATGRAR